MKGENMAEHKYYTCKYDRPFKEIFLNKNNENLLIKLLEKILNVKILSINLEPNERNSLNINVKRKTYDVLLNTNVGKIILDINANNKNYVHPRNVAYLCDLYSLKKC